MAVVYIREYEDLAATLTGQAQAGLEPKVADQTVAIIATSTSSLAFNVRTNIIRVHTDAICSIDVAASPTATTSTARMAANTTEFFGVKPGHKIAVITNT